MHNVAMVDLVRAVAPRRARPRPDRPRVAARPQPWIVPIRAPPSCTGWKRTSGADVSCPKARSPADRGVSKIEIQGGRYPEALEAQTNL